MMKKMTMALNSVQFPFLPSSRPRKAMLQKRLQERLKTVRRLQLAAKTEGNRTLPTPIRPAPATEPGLTPKINTIMPTISPGRTVTFSAQEASKATGRLSVYHTKETTKTEIGATEVLAGAPVAVAITVISAGATSTEIIETIANMAANSSIMAMITIIKEEGADIRTDETTSVSKVAITKNSTKSKSIPIQIIVCTIRTILTSSVSALTKRRRVPSSSRFIYFSQKINATMKVNQLNWIKERKR